MKQSKQEAYCAYLKEWADIHAGVGYEGMTPACFDEWLMCEGSEYQDDVDSAESIVPCDICRDAPAVVFGELHLDGRHDVFVQALKKNGINICQKCFDAAMEDALQPCSSVVIHSSEGQVRAVFAPDAVSSGFYLEADFDDYAAGEAEERFNVINTYLRAYSPGMRALM